MLINFKQWAESLKNKDGEISGKSRFLSVSIVIHFNYLGSIAGETR